MGTYVKRSCGKCGGVLEGWATAYRSLGSPLAECPHCHTHIRLRHQNEWDTMAPGEKFLHMISMLWTCAIWTFGVGFILPGAACLIYVLAFGDGEKTVGDLVEIVLPAAAPPLALLGLAMAIAGVRRELRDSRARLENPEYARLLAQHGFSLRRTSR